MDIATRLTAMGKKISKCMGRSIITIFISDDGEYGIGFYDRLIFPKCNQKGKFRPYFRIDLTEDMLRKTLEEVLEMIVYIIKTAEKKGIEFKGENVRW